MKELIRTLESVLDAWKILRIFKTHFILFPETTERYTTLLVD